VKRLLILKFAIFTSIALINIAFTPKSFAQSQSLLKCGDIVRGELTQSEQTKIDFAGKNPIRYGDFYRVQIEAGTKIALSIKPLGNTLNVGFILLDSANNPVFWVNRTKSGQAEKLDDFTLGSSKQGLIVVGMAPDRVDEQTDLGFYYSDYGRYFGAYEIRLGCTLSDGTIIEPGDAAGASPTKVPSIATLPGVGFPGLPPVDFSQVAKIPLIVGTPMTGAITPTGGEILGYMFDGKANSTAELTFTRLSGTLNLGLVVLSDDNKVVYQASLVTSKSMTTTFTLPKDGKYTVGVFKIDLLPPTSPEATAFQVQIKQ